MSHHCLQPYCPLPPFLGANSTANHYPHQRVGEQTSVFVYNSSASSVSFKTVETTSYATEPCTVVTQSMFIMSFPSVTVAIPATPIAMSLLYCTKIACFPCISNAMSVLKTKSCQHILWQCTPPLSYAKCTIFWQDASPMPDGKCGYLNCCCSERKDVSS